MRSPEVVRLVDEFFFELHFRYALCTISLLYSICIVSDYKLSDYTIDPKIIYQIHTALSPPLCPMPHPPSPLPFSCEFLTECGWGHDIPHEYMGLQLDRPGALNAFREMRVLGRRAHMWI
jgi:hypothetical protein